MTSSTLRFFFNPMSRARMVRWMQEECGAEYESVQLEFGTTMKSPDYLAINPMGKVPAITDGGTVITETGAILAYLADKYPHKQLAPAVGSAARGEYYRWLFFVGGPVEAATTAKSEGWLQEQTARQAVSAGFGRFDDLVRTLEQAVAGKRYLCGDHFTAADLYMASYLRWSMMTGQLPQKEVFQAYAEPLCARPAALRANAIDALPGQAQGAPLAKQG
ncbi:MAG: glutathione S-transferase family protein [Comamonas sp.]